MLATIQPIHNQFSAKIYSKGKLSIPATIRKDLHLNDGSEVIFIKHGQSWALTTREKLFNDAQIYFNSLKSQNKSIVDEFIAERRAQAITDER